MDFLRTSKTGFKKNCSEWLLINALLINNSTGKHLLKVTEKETRITFIDAAPLFYIADFELILDQKNKQTHAQS